MSIFFWISLSVNLFINLIAFLYAYQSFLGEKLLKKMYIVRFNIFYKDKINFFWPFLVYFDCYWYRLKKYITIGSIIYVISILSISGMFFYHAISFREFETNNNVNLFYVEDALFFLLPIFITSLFIFLFFWLIWKRRKSLKGEELSWKSFDLVKIDENEKFDFNFIVYHRSSSFCKLYQTSLKFFVELKDKEIKKYSRNKIDDNTKYFLILLLCIRVSFTLERYEQSYSRKEMVILQGSKEFSPQELADYFYRYIISEVTKIK